MGSRRIFLQRIYQANSRPCVGNGFVSSSVYFRLQSRIFRPNGDKGGLNSTLGGKLISMPFVSAALGDVVLMAGTGGIPP